MSNTPWNERPPAEQMAKEAQEKAARINAERAAQRKSRGK